MGDNFIWSLVWPDALMQAYIAGLVLGWILFMLMCIMQIGTVWSQVEEMCQMKTAYEFDDGDERKERLEDTMFPSWWMDAEKRVDANLSREEAIDLYHLEHKYNITHGDEVLVLLQYRYLYLLGQWHEYSQMREAS